MTETQDAQGGPQRVGILVVTHGNFGAALLEAAGMIVGSIETAAAVSVLMGKAVDEIVDDLKTALAALDTGMGVLVLTDLFGGTPTTLSLSLRRSANIEVVAGVNLPMLLKVLPSRDQTLADLAVQAKGAGQQGIVAPGEMLRSRKGQGG